MATAMIRGISVVLYQRIPIRTDCFNRTVYVEDPVTVENVLIAPISSSENLETTDISGKRTVYQLAIPKGDNHEWTSSTVEFFGEKFKVIGEPVKGIESMIPLDWNKKIQVEKIG